MIRKRIVYSGHVQGVGFRYSVARVATNYDLTGYVKNLSNGSVEIVLEGQPTEIQSLIDSLKQEMGVYIRQTQVHDESANNEFDDFSIKY